MDLLFIILASLGVFAILVTKDNVLAAFTLLAIGLLTAGYAAAVGYPALFVLVALAYIASALVLVIVAAAAISENGARTALRPYAVLPLVLAALGFLPGGAPQPRQVDPGILLPITAFVLFSLLVALRLGRP